MSRPGRSRFISKTDKAEREVLIKLLKAYKEMPCLWNPCDPDYSNILRKNVAQEKLLKIYKAIDPNANRNEMRKKLENMRSSGKRYFKKKLEAKTKGKNYSSRLWYYNRIKFVYGDDGDTDIEDDPILLSDEEESKLTNERPKEYASKDNEFSNDNFEANSSTSSVVVVATNTDEDDGILLLDNPSGLSNKSSEIKENICEEASLFGTTIDQQLLEVDPEQKQIAENLILRVVHLAKMNKLTPNTDISL